MKLQVFVVLAFAFSAMFCHASVEAQAGQYRISLSTQPKVIPVGQAKIDLVITDASGKQLEGLDVRAIARMPGMFMGEREQRANPVPGIPGKYSMQAAFPMAGKYAVDMKISGSNGNETVSIPLQTGQDTGSANANGFSFASLLPWLIAIALVIFVVLRVRASGQRLDTKSILNRGTIGGVLLLVALFAISVYAVNNWRRQGAMTPLEAQVMEMNTPAPPGSTAVQLATATLEPLSETVSYTGQAVGFVEQDVIARGTGVIVWMPLYVGDNVTKGQVVARLDTSQLDPQLAEKAAMSNMASQGVSVAAAEYGAALQEVAEAQANVSVKEGGVGEAEAMLQAAQQDKAALEADLSALISEATNAEAEVEAAVAAEKYWKDELARMRQLFASKAISASELQQTESEYARAKANLHHGNGMVESANSKVIAAGANIRKANAMIAAAQKRVRQAEAEVRAARSAVLSKQRAADAAKKRIGREQAGVDQARAGYESASAQRGYASLKSEVNGVITQRLISPGVLVNPGQSVLKIAQVSPIRLQATVPEGDLAKISVGAKVTISSRDSKGKSVQTFVSSVSPSVDARARTGVVEIVWQNSDSEFLPGQFVKIEIEVGESQDAISVPVEAIQHPAGESGGSPFVWIAESSGDAGQFTVRRSSIALGISNGKRTAITMGLKEGQQVVMSGAMYLREGGSVSAQVAEIEANGPIIEVMSVAYKPDKVEAEVGKPITITFIRRTEQGCGTEVVFPDLKIKKLLPLNKPVTVTFTPQKRGEIRFTCSMDMFDGRVVVR